MLHEYTRPFDPSDVDPDPDFERETREELDDHVHRTWWLDEVHPEQTAHEMLMLCGGHVTVREAPVLFEKMLAAMARGEADGVPY